MSLEGGFQAGRTYELTYEAANPPVAGLGFAAVRDTVAWIKHAPDAPVKAQRALAFGSSQSGRFLRTFLYYGFNGDEQNRLVFDGVMAHIAGASRLDLNRRWATPTNLGQFDATSFPFADAALRDPATGAEEGALDNPRAKDFKPKIFYTNTGVEYWGGARSAALIHTTPDGAKDLVLPDNERVYFLTGSQHGPTRFPPAEPRLGAQRENPNDYWLAMRALLVAMDDWLRSNKAPPPSRYPQLANGTLVPAAKVAFPALPGVRAPQQLPAGARVPNPLVAKDGGAGHHAAVPRAADRQGRHRARRRALARHRSAARDVHGLEFPQPRRSAGRTRCIRCSARTFRSRRRPPRARRRKIRGPRSRNATRRSRRISTRSGRPPTSS